MAQCSSGSDGFLTVGCLARGFSPEDSLTFKWKDSTNKELSDFVQYPAFGRDGDYTKISHLRVKKSDWDPKKPYICEASNSKGRIDIKFAPPVKRVIPPTIALLSREEGDSIVLQCQLKDYYPDKLTVQWFRDGQPFSAADNKMWRTTDEVNKNFTYISQISISAQYEDKQYTCKATHDSTVFKQEYNMCRAKSLFKPSIQVKIANLTDILKKSAVTFSCIVEAPHSTVVSWQADGAKKDTGAPKHQANKIVSDFTLPRNERLQFKTIVCTAKHPCFPEENVQIQTDDMRKDPVVVIRRTFEKSGQSGSALLECVVKDLPSGEVCIDFQVNHSDISDVSCVDWTPSENIWSLTTHFKIPSEHQKEGNTFTCKVHRRFKSWASEPTGNIFAPAPDQPATVYLTVPTQTELENGTATFLCLARKFSPKTYSFKWFQGDQEVKTVIDVYDTSEENGSVTLYSATSILQITAENWQKPDTKIKCEFGHKVGTESREAEYTGHQDCSNIAGEIVPPSFEDMLRNRTGVLKCKASGAIGFTKIEITANNFVINSKLNIINKEKVELDVPIGYEEWSNGTVFTCTVEHNCLPQPREFTFSRENGEERKKPSVYLLAPPEHKDVEMMTLTCFVKDFYPKEVFVSWLADDEPVNFMYKPKTSQPMQNENKSFSVYSQITVSYSEWKDGTVYSCVVYHEMIDKKMRVLTRSIADNMDKPGVINLSMNTPACCKE